MLRVRQPANLDARKNSFPHQVEALDALKDLTFAGIFDEQGLGKTKIGLDLALLWLRRDMVDSVLIITKKGLIDNWREEVASHSYLKPRVLGQDRNENFFSFNSPVRLYLAHYEVISSERKRLSLFLKTRRVGVILDEAHRIKNPDTNVAKALHELSEAFTYRVIMTGTPVANRPYDLWSQIKFLDGGATFGNDFTSFRNEFDLTNELSQDNERASHFTESLEQLFARIRRFSVRRTKETSGLSLPGKAISNLKCKLEPCQEEIYRKFRDELAAIVIQEGKPVLDDVEAILKRLMRLVQVASNPALVDESYRENPGKFPELERLVYGAVDKGDKVVVWTAFVENAEFLGRKLQKAGTSILHGELGMAMRRQALRAFKEDKNCRVLVATPGAAKEGLTLTVANHAIFYDRSFSLDDYLQAQDRIHRISQQKPCIITNLVAEDTIDIWVDSLLSAKHLAAQLAQGDIGRDEYERRADYSFGDILKEVLNLQDMKEF